MKTILNRKKEKSVLENHVERKDIIVETELVRILLNELKFLE
jgi:hypothetical protein